MTETNQHRIHLHVIKDSKCIKCSLKLNEEEMKKKLWVGLYVVRREHDNKYTQFINIDTSKPEVIFEYVRDGIYEVRLFEGKYNKIETSDPITVG